MKYLLLFALLGAFSIQASATEGPAIETAAAPGNGKTYFETLKDLYDQGSLPDLPKLADTFWSGRCFDAKNPEVLKQGFALHIRYNKITAAYEILTIMGGHEPAQFDGFTREAFVAAFKPFESKYPRANIENRTVWTAESQNVLAHRASGKYLVLAASTYSKDGPIGGNEGLEVLKRCYFFIPGLKF